MSPKICYEPKKFRAETVTALAQANAIIEEYAAQGYELTLRQLYYQFVARGLLDNTFRNYKKLGCWISDGRRAGIIDWDAIVDRTRELRSVGSWDSPASMVAGCVHQFRTRFWDTQPAYVEVWFEKDALMGVFDRVAAELRLPYFSCRGYTSDSEVWGAAQRLAARGQDHEVVVLHFGDHDPSGIDMTRDITDRLALFGAPNVDVRRLALNMAQVEQYQPPPNPAKETDSRFDGYRKLYGDESWELDALDPPVLAALVRREVAGLVDLVAWDKAADKEDNGRVALDTVATDWDIAADAAISKLGKSAVAKRRNRLAAHRVDWSNI